MDWRQTSLVTPTVFALLLEPVTSHKESHTARAVHPVWVFLLLVFSFLGGIMVVNLILVFWSHECDGSWMFSQGSACDFWTWNEKREFAGVFISGLLSVSDSRTLLLPYCLDDALLGSAASRLSVEVPVFLFIVQIKDQNIFLRIFCVIFYLYTVLFVKYLTRAWDFILFFSHFFN